MTDWERLMTHQPILHVDRHETIPFRAVGCSVFHASQESRSFPGRVIRVPENGCVLEYAFYLDYDAEHMYDLEHIWVTLDAHENVLDAQGSFHGKVLNLLIPEWEGYLPPENGRIHAFVQPGKHAMLARPEMTRLYPGWDQCCRMAGGPVLIGNPFSARFAPGGRDLFVPSREDDAHSCRWLREHLSFVPSLEFDVLPAFEKDRFFTWEELYRCIPGWIAEECARLHALYG
ncbi:MAG: hypothetical protein IJ246_00660 [Clostridia bacterium]|nr:hypothetical protein [Clostridia bacterium]